jgi:hypothetical protein
VIEKGMRVRSRGNLKEQIPGKAAIWLNRQASGATSSIHSPCKTVYCRWHLFIRVCPFSPSLCISIHFPAASSVSYAHCKGNLTVLRR